VSHVRRQHIALAASAGSTDQETMVTDIGRRLAIGMLVASIFALPIGPMGASAAEVCHYTGSTDYDGHVAVTTNVTESDGVTRVDVVGMFDATTMFWLHIHYLLEEVSTWRDGELQSVAVNSRYLVGDHVVRQSWDHFHRTSDGLLAYRVQGKTLADFRRQHPKFVQHWDPAAFGQPWIGDYQLASPERRPDLDLAGSSLPQGVRSPLAMAFYWVRWLPRGEQSVPIFLPGFKKDRFVNLPIALSRRLAARCGKRPCVTRRSASGQSPSPRPRSLRTGIRCGLRSRCMDRAHRGGD
jgi:hypothetical protein